MKMSHQLPFGISHHDFFTNSEYLYEYWLIAYQKYISDAREEVRKHTGGAVLRADIRDFYMRIEQEKLIELATQALAKGQSKRIEWLIRLLLSRNLDEHELGHGIVQGSLSSGFCANVYLTDVDSAFGVDNEWSVEIFRFVDDMILVIPEPEGGTPIQAVVAEVEARLITVLESLSLELNPDKTEVYYDTAEFISVTEPDALLEQMAEKFDQLTSPLWILDTDCRSIFVKSADNDELWWYRIEIYCECLKQIEVFTSPAIASRRVHRYLYDQNRRKKDLKGEEELVIDDLPDDNTTQSITAWEKAFESNNKPWLDEKLSLRARLVALLEDGVQRLSQSSSLPTHERRQLETRIRFAINRLSTLGFGPAVRIVTDLLEDFPWVTKEPSHVLENLAMQGYSNELLEIFAHFSSDSHEMNQYMRTVVLRAMRFLPEVGAHHWGIITAFAIDGKLTEKLMATETWLFLSESSGFSLHSQQAETIEEVLETQNSLPTRLEKNYILLVTKYDDSKAYQTQSTDALLHQALEVAQSGEVSDLINYIEPDMIRRDYYSGKQSGDPDYTYPT